METNSDATPSRPKQLYAARNPDTPAETLERLSEEADLEIFTRLLSNKNLPGKAIANIFSYDEESCILSIAKHPNTPVNILQELYERDKFEIIEAIVDNPNAPAEMLHSIAIQYEHINSIFYKNSLNLIWTKVAHHPNASEETLDHLSKTDIAGVTFSLIYNPNTSAKTIEALTRKLISGSIRPIADIARHPNMPAHVITELYPLSLKMGFAGEIAINKNTPDDIIRELAASKEASVLNGLANNPALPADLIKTLAKSEYDDCRYFISLRTDCPEETLEELSSDSYARVRLGVAKNSKAPDRILAGLSTDPAEHVRDAAIKHISARTTNSVQNLPLDLK